MSAPPLLRADAFGAAELHAAFAGAFSDYLAGPFQLTLAQWPSLLARQGIDLARSRVAVRDGAIAAFAFACPRPGRGRWRLAAMGALPAARGSGAAPALLDDFLLRARAQGLAWAELECFAENERALRLYRSRGFEVVCALDGWKASEGPAPAAAPDVDAIDRASAFAWLEDADRRLGWLPFPGTAQSLAGQPRPLAFWRCGDALLAFSVVEGTPTQVHGLVDHDPALEGAAALARALRAAHPDSFAPPILRGDLGGAALERAGYVRHGLSQVLMKRRL